MPLANVKLTAELQRVQAAVPVQFKHPISHAKQLLVLE